MVYPSGDFRKISMAFCAANPSLFSCCNVMRLDGRCKTSMHFVVQRQLTDVSDCKKNNLPQLLTSIHKSQFMHGTSPRDFVTFLQTCMTIYKVVTNAMEGIFCQIKTLWPEGKWPDALDWHEICAGSAERGIFSFFKGCLLLPT